MIFVSPNYDGITAAHPCQDLSMDLGRPGVKGFPPAFTDQQAERRKKMSLVTRDEILDYVTYEEQRELIRSQTLKVKEPRRIHLGEYLTFLFETKETVRYQIQEMMRIEKIVREADIQNEINTYNQLLGKPGELGCTLLIEIDDKELREIKLKKLLDLPRNIYLVLETGEKVMAQFDEAQVGTDQLSAVQYLRFRVEGNAPVAIGVHHPEITEQTDLTPEQKEALTHDATAAPQGVISFNNI